MAPECERHHKRIAEKLSAKKKESYADTMKFIRTKLRFVLLRSILIALRGQRGKKPQETKMLQDISFNLIPSDPFYETA